MQHTHSPFQTRNALKSFVSGKQLVTFRSPCLRNTIMPGTTIHIWRDVKDNPQPSTCISSESHAGASDIDTRHLYQKCSSMRIHDSYLKIVHLLGMLTFKISREFDWLWITGFLRFVKSHQFTMNSFCFQGSLPQPWPGWFYSPRVGAIVFTSHLVSHNTF